MPFAVVVVVVVGGLIRRVAIVVPGNGGCGRFGQGSRTTQQPQGGEWEKVQGDKDEQERKGREKGAGCDVDAQKADVGVDAQDRLHRDTRGVGVQDRTAEIIEQ